MQRDLAELDRFLAGLDVSVEEQERRKAHLNQEIGATRQEIRRIEEELAEKQRLGAELPDAHELRARKSALEEQRDALVKERGSLEVRKKRLEEEKERLAGQKTLLLPEQERILRTYRQAGIRAAAFGELFDVKEGLDRSAVEAWLAPLKHTVFVERLLERVAVEKGFYVVPLPAARRRPWFGAAGRRSNIFEYIAFSAGEDFPADFLERVEEWLANVEVRFAEGVPEPAAQLVLANGTLWDRFGARGAVEPGEAIGVRALEEARRRVATELAQLVGRLEELDEETREAERLLNEVSFMLSAREDADRMIPVLREKRAALDQTLVSREEELRRVADELQKMRELRQSRAAEQTKKEMAKRQVEGELALWAEYAREQKSIARLKELEARIAEGKVRMDEKAARSDFLLREIDALNREIRSAEQEVEAGQRELQRVGALAEQARKTVEELDEEACALTLEKEEWEKRHRELKEKFSSVIGELVRLGQWLPPVYQEQDKTRTNLERKEREGRARLDDALSRVVNEDARQVYNDYVYEYQQAQKEFEESRLRFEQLKAKEEERRQDFHKNVLYRLQRTNQRFADFMQRLGMAGEVRLVEPDEESRHPVYQWELHVATRPGHRPEKIFPESGRVVGEGISGGERAATSLVFALALLSDIENRPPFYVLDEFDSNLDEERKHDIFDLYYAVLRRKLIIVSPKVHGDQYLDRFHKFLCVVANPGVQPGQQVSEVYEVTRERYRETVEGD
ncbi:MAG: hypothetical protein ACPLQO_06740 [Desulfotomaculales bacterium]